MKFDDVDEDSNSSKIVVVAESDQKHWKDAARQRDLCSDFAQVEQHCILMELMGHIRYKEMSQL